MSDKETLPEMAESALVVKDTRAMSQLPDPEPGQLVASPAGAILMMAMQHRLPTDQIQLFVNAHEREKEEQRKAAYATAMAKAQAEYLPVVKHKKSDRGKFAPMDEGVEAVRVANGKYGLSFKHRATSVVIDGSDPLAAKVTVVPVVMYGLDGKISYEEDGEPMETVAVEIPGSKPEFPQMSLIRAIKGAVTFIRRMTFEAAFGIAPTDDNDMAGQPKGRSQDNQGQHQEGGGNQQQRPPQERQEPAQREEPLPAWMDKALAYGKTLGITKAHMEGSTGRGLAKPAAKWTEGEDKQKIKDIYKDAQLVAVADRPAWVKDAFEREPEREPGQEG